MSENDKALANVPPEDKKNKTGLLGRVIKGVGQVGAGVTGAAGKGLASLTDAANTTTKLAWLNFSDKIKREELENRSTSELGVALTDWLMRHKKGQITTEYLNDDRVIVRLSEQGLLGKDYVFGFLPEARADWTADLCKADVTGPKCSGVAVLALTWPYDRMTLEDNMGLFVWQDGIRLGKDDTLADDYVALWLKDYTGHQFEKKALIENTGRTTERDFFIGREDILTTIGRSVATVNQDEARLPWIFSLWGEGGLGKSYLLQRLQQLYGRRMLYAQVDHQSREESEYNLLSLIRQLAGRLQNSGLNLSNFGKINTPLLRAETTALADKSNRTLTARDVAHGVTDALKTDTASNVLGFVARNIKRAGFLKYIPGMMNVAGVAVDIGFNVYDRISEEQKARNEAVLNSQPIQALTKALVQDLADYVAEQRKKYYLWRRPVLVFDTYELIGPLADQWLRTVFLADSQLRQLEPVIVIAGRYELLRLNSRWSEYQVGMRQIRLEKFDRAQTGEYLARLGVTDPARVDALYELTDGHPLFLSLSANLSTEEAAIKVLTERILEEIEPEWHETFVEMTVPEGFNLDTVRRIISDEARAKAAYDRLNEATFVESRAGLTHFLPTVRKVLSRYGQLTSPQAMQQVRQLLS